MASDRQHGRGGINVVALTKGRERYVWLFRTSDKAAVVKSLGRFAANPELSFSWFDAAILSEQARKMKDERKSTR